MDEKGLTRFFFELGLLKNMQRSGWFFIGELCGDSVASHSFRTAIIAYALAKELKADVGKCVLMALFHDVEETRVGDINRVWVRNVKANPPRFMPYEEMEELAEEYRRQETVEAKIVKDADLLEVAMQGKEYVMKGNKLAEEWVENAGKGLNFEVSKRIWEHIRKGMVWWEGLKEHKPNKH